MATINAINGKALSAISHINGTAKNQIAGKNGTPVESAGTPTAPSLISTSTIVEGSANQNTTVSVTAGDLICAWVYIYSTADNYTGYSIGDGTNTYTQQAQPDVGDYAGGVITVKLTLWTAVAASTNASLTLTTTGGSDYVALIVQVVRGQDATTFLDVPITTFSAYADSGTINCPSLNTTTFSHCLVVGAWSWSNPALIATYTATWPFVAGDNDGSAAPIAITGKSTTATAVHTPDLNPSTVTGANYCGIAFAIRGKNV